MLEEAKPNIAFSIDFEGFVEGMEESFLIPSNIARYDIFNELDYNLNYCLEFFDAHGIEATFFILGWIAEKYPNLIKKICNNGHELASHSLYHKRLTNLPVDLAKQYLEKSKNILEDLSGKAVIGFRAPDFSLITDDDFLDFMLKIGFKYDSSMVFTNIHDVYKGPLRKSNIYYFNNGLVEFPISNIFLSKLLCFSVGGGGYLRLYPTFITEYFLKNSISPIYYIHPYELSGEYPKGIKMNLYREFRHTFNIKRVASKTVKIMNNFKPISVSRYLKNKNYLD